MHRLLLILIVAAILAWIVMSCSSGSIAQLGGVTIEPLGSPTAAGTPVGGKPATPPAAATATPAASTSNTTPNATPATVVSATDPGLAPTEGQWIEVDVTKFIVRLMDGRSVVREIGPVAVGAQVDTGVYASTQTGLFHVYNKSEDLAYDPPYDTYISNWVGFDPDKANGFHSFLKDKSGKVVDASTGRVSNGCIRTGAETAIFAFAEIGMPVWVHA
jgi:hypothetical protein